MNRTTAGWWFAGVRLAAGVGIGLVVGWMLGAVWPGLAATLAAYLVWHLVHLFRLDWWLRHRGSSDPPDATGLWGDVVAQVVRLHRRKQFHKQRLIQLFRQLRRSTAALPDGVVVLDKELEILWFNGTASRSATAGRSGPAHRQPVATARLHALRARRRVRYAHHHSTGCGQSTLSVDADRSLWGGAAASAREGCLTANAPGGAAQGLRCQRLARAAFAAHGDHRLSRDFEPGPRAGS